MPQIREILTILIDFNVSDEYEASARMLFALK